MPKSNANLALKGLDEMFSTEESRQEQKREQVQQIPIGELFPFKEHPFKVLADEAMQRTVHSGECGTVWCASSVECMEDVIIKLLEQWQRKQQRQNER